MNAHRIVRYLVLVSAVILGLIVVLAVAFLVNPGLVVNETERDAVQDPATATFHGRSDSPTPATTNGSDLGLTPGDSVEEIESDLESLELDDLESELEEIDQEAQGL